MASGEVFTCNFCHEPRATLRCSGCKSAVYCTADHQKKHWKEHKLDCKPFKVGHSEEAGRYLEATRDIAAGAFILTEHPLVVGPKWVLDETEKKLPVVPCIGCFQPTLVYGQHRCKQCHWAACSPDCPGLENDRLHKIECGVLRFGRPPLGGEEDPEVVLDYFRHDSLFALKCLMLQSKNVKKWEELMKLESHEKERKDSIFYEDADNRIVSYLMDNFLNLVKIFETKSGTSILAKCDKEILHKICGIIEVNAMMIRLPTGQEVSGIYPTACLLEHSCLPNCTYNFSMTDGFKILVKAGRDIKKGEHLTTSYTHTLYGTQARRDHLMTTKYFTCKCARCLDKTELGTFFSALKCFGTDINRCGGNQLPLDPLDPKSEWACDQCPIRLEADQVNFLMIQMGEEVDTVVYNKDATVRDTEALIDKLSQFLHKNHFHIFSLKYSLIQLIGHHKEYLTVQLAVHVLEQKIKLCKDIMDVIEKLDPHSIRLAIYTAVVLHELALSQIELASRKIKASTEPEEKIEHAKQLDEAEQYIARGKEILENEQDTPEGQKAMEKLEKLDHVLQEVLNLAVI